MDQRKALYSSSTEAENAPILSSQLSVESHCLPATSGGDMTTQVSLSVSYSSSGPSLEQLPPTAHPPGDNSKEWDRGGEIDGKPAVLVTVTEPQSGSNSSSVLSSREESPVEPAEVLSADITQTTTTVFSLTASASPPPNIPTHGGVHSTSSASREEHSNSFDQLVGSGGNSMSVEVDDQLLELVSAGNNSLRSSETNSQLSDVGSYSGEDEDSLSLTPRAVELDIGGDQAVKTTTVSPILNQPTLDRTEERESKAITEGGDGEFGEQTRAREISTVGSPQTNPGGDNRLLDVKHDAEHDAQPSAPSPITEPQAQSQPKTSLTKPR